MLKNESRKMIAEKKEEKQIILSEMEEKKVEFMTELAKFMVEWIDRQTLITIKENSSKLLAMGEEKARELKVEITELQTSSVTLVEIYES